MSLESFFSLIKMPNEVYNDTKAFLAKLFGKSVEEMGELLADHVRVRRWTNQIKILSKTKKILEENNLEPKQLDLKVLAPLLEFSSLEENETLQEKWANLICNVSSKSYGTMFQQNAIHILNRLSSKDAKLLDKIYVLCRQIETNNRTKHANNFNPNYRRPESEIEKLGVFDLEKQIKISSKLLVSLLSNLELLGLIQINTELNLVMDQSTMDDAPKLPKINTYSDPNDTHKEPIFSPRTKKIATESTKFHVHKDTQYIEITKFGVDFIRLCKKPKSKTRTQKSPNKINFPLRSLRAFAVNKK